MPGDSDRTPHAPVGDYAGLLVIMDGYGNVTWRSQATKPNSGSSTPNNLQVQDNGTIHLIYSGNDI
jgi:hypothetical protein